jgi:uncharacterized membrane protein
MERHADNGATRASRALVLFVVGFFIAFLGIIILAVAALVPGGSASYGGVIFVGPIPIVFGAGPQATWLILFAIVLAVLTVVIFVLMRRRGTGEALYSCFSSLP